MMLSRTAAAAAPERMSGGLEWEIWKVRGLEGSVYQWFLGDRSPEMVLRKGKEI